MVTGVTYAVWVRQVNATQELNVPVDTYNPSEKYIIFHGINNAGELVDSSPTGYAVVGYDGLVAELIIPDEHNSLPVKKICVDPDQQLKRLTNNDIITSIRIPANVTTISAGACQAMDHLTTVIFEGTTPAVTIGDYAFANCPNLTTFTCERTITGDSTKYLLGTAVE